MLEQIRKSHLFRLTNLLLLGGLTLALTSCATKSEPQLVSTGAERESTLPWNQQQKWEGAGQFGPLAEEMGGRR